MYLQTQLAPAWMRAVRNYRGVGVAEALAGDKLIEIVCKYMRKPFTVHRSLLKGNQEINIRTRDPPSANLVGIHDEELEFDCSRASVLLYVVLRPFISHGLQRRRRICGVATFFRNRSVLAVANLLNHASSASLLSWESTCSSDYSTGHTLKAEEYPCTVKRPS